MSAKQEENKENVVDAWLTKSVNNEHIFDEKDDQSTKTQSICPASLSSKDLKSIELHAENEEEVKKAEYRNEYNEGDKQKRNPCGPYSGKTCEHSSTCRDEECHHLPNFIHETVSVSRTDKGDEQMKVCTSNDMKHCDDTCVEIDETTLLDVSVPDSCIEHPSLLDPSLTSETEVNNGKNCHSASRPLLSPSSAKVMNQALTEKGIVVSDDQTRDNQNQNQSQLDVSNEKQGESAGEKQGESAGEKRTDMIPLVVLSHPDNTCQLLDHDVMQECIDSPGMIFCKKKNKDVDDIAFHFDNIPGTIPDSGPKLQTRTKCMIVLLAFVALAIVLLVGFLIP